MDSCAVCGLFQTQAPTAVTPSVTFAVTPSALGERTAKAQAHVPVASG